MTKQKYIKNQNNYTTVTSEPSNPQTYFNLYIPSGVSKVLSLVWKSLNKSTLVL